MSGKPYDGGWRPVSQDGNGTLYGPENAYEPGSEHGPRNPRKRHQKRTAAIVIIVICAVIVVAAAAGGFSWIGQQDDTIVLSDNQELHVSGDYVGMIYIDGEITDSDSTSQTGYRHNFLMNLVDMMEQDSSNKGILIYMNTPGGSSYLTDEFYLKLMEYKKQTGRPIYTYMAEEGCSGGYYIACASDRIIANRNCWTGSIGVTLSTIYDLTGLLDKIGVKTVTIHAGENKEMGSAVETLTDEQKEILQSLVDETYDQFVEVVEKGRGLSHERVLELADGRIYTAKQAKENGLIDQISDLSGAWQTMQEKCGLQGVALKQIVHEEDKNSLGSLFSMLFSSKVSNKNEESGSEISQEIDSLNDALELNGKVKLEYIAELDKS